MARDNGQTQGSAAQLEQLVAADGTTGGFIKDSQAGTGGLAVLDDAAVADVLTTIGAAPGANAIINGDFSVSQRGASFTAATTPLNSDDTYLLDRWVLLSDGNDIVDVTQNTTAAQLPTGAITGISLDVETANKKFGIIQFIERANCGHLLGGNATLTFAAKKRSANATVDTLRAAIVTWSSTADAVTSDVVSAWNIEGTDPTLIANWTYENTPSNLTLTNSYQTFTITAAIDTASGANVGVFIWCDNADGTVGDFVDITNVKLESGSVASAYAPRGRGVEIQLCQRYFRKSYAQGTAPGTSTTAGSVVDNAHGAAQASRWYVPVTPVMRTTLTPVVYSTDGTAAKVRDLSGAANKTASTADPADSGFTVYPTENLNDNVIIGFHYTAEAEL